MKIPCIVTRDTNRYLNSIDRANADAEWLEEKEDELFADYVVLIKDFYSKREKADAFFNEVMELADYDQLNKLIRSAYSSRDECRNFWMDFVDDLLRKRAAADAIAELDKLKMNGAGDY